MLVYSSKATTSGFPAKEEWGHVIPAGSTQESASSRAHESRLPLPGNGSYVPAASKCYDVEDSTCAATVPKSRGGCGADSV